MQMPHDIPALLEGVFSGHTGALARCITVLENELVHPSQVVGKIQSRLGHSYVYGITGPPGVGKSTLIDGLIRRVRGTGATVGLVAVDPSSPVTDGAILGDRIRMCDLQGDEGVYIRSMATRGKLGGLSKKVPAVVNLLDAFGMDVTIVETAGVGQTEIEVARIADTTILVMSPHSGDSIQAMKAGIIEMADIFVINKADTGDACRLRLDLEEVLRLRERDDGWQPVIVEAEARRGVGIEQTLETMESHREFLIQHDLVEVRRGERREKQFVELLREELLDRLLEGIGLSSAYGLHRDKVRAGEEDEYSACEALLDEGLVGQLRDGMFCERGEMSWQDRL